jgi:uncharacterized membrane protein
MATPPRGRSLDGMYYGDHMDRGGWILPTVIMVLLAALVVVAIVWFVRNQRPGAPPRPDGGAVSARELLDRRLVSGEIGEDEYRRLRTALSETPPPRQPPEPTKS